MSDSTIIDPRPLEAFKDKTFSDFKKREVKIRGFGNWKNYDFKRI